MEQKKAAAAAPEEDPYVQTDLRTIEWLQRSLAERADRKRELQDTRR